MSEAAVAPARRGRPVGSKDKAPRAPRTPRTPRPKGTVYVARKPMRIGERMIKVGDLVPEAGSWPRVESWIRAGFLDVKG